MSVEPRSRKTADGPGAGGARATGRFRSLKGTGRAMETGDGALAWKVLRHVGEYGEAWARHGATFRISTAWRNADSGFARGTVAVTGVAIRQSRTAD